MDNNIKKVIEYLESEKNNYTNLFSLPLKINKLIYTLEMCPNRLCNERLYKFIMNSLGNKEDCTDEPGSEYLYKKIEINLNKILNQS